MLKIAQTLHDFRFKDPAHRRNTHAIAEEMRALDAGENFHLPKKYNGKWFLPDYQKIQRSIDPGVIISWVNEAIYYGQSDVRAALLGVLQGQLQKKDVHGHHVLSSSPSSIRLGKDELDLVGGDWMID